MSFLARIAQRAPATAFPLIGDGGRRHARPLAADPRLHLAESPRHATVLLVLGALPEALHEQARRVHDQLPSPRGTVVLDAEGRSRAPFTDAEVVRDPSALSETVARVHRALLSHARPSEGVLGPKDNPVEWRGVGPHGQGGEGMMGGTPYGRPMAMTGPDVRDGLELDRVKLPIGPFLRWIPPGIRFDLVLQGDVVQEARAHAAPFTHRDEADVFRRAIDEAVSVAEIEVERARHHLFALSDLLSLHGLGPQARRVARLATGLSAADGSAIQRLYRRLRRTAALRMGTRGVGTLDAETVEDGMGPVGRAAGVDHDARTDDPAYRDLGLTPITHGAGDAEARWQQRLAEASQALSLARRAGDRMRPPGPPLEGPRGVVGEHGGATCRDLLERVSVGQAFDAFATTVVSLDLDASTIPDRPDGPEDGPGDEGHGGNEGDGGAHEGGEGPHEHDGSAH